MSRLSGCLRTVLLGVTLAISGVILNDASVFAMSGSSSTVTPPSCREGWVWNKAKRICERKGSGVLEDGGSRGPGRTVAFHG